MAVATGEDVDENDDGSCATEAVWDAGLAELADGDVELSSNAVPFHNTLHELVLRLLGTWSQKRKSLLLRTVKPLGSVALPCLRTE
jgi:hypothetical protein